MKKDGRCIHYNGILGGNILDKVALRERRCEAGVRYADVREPGDGHGLRIPCMVETQGTVECALREFPTAAQIAESERELNAHIAEMGRRVEASECIECGAPVQRYREVRPCVYAEPCGHRQWQGRAPKPKAAAWADLQSETEALDGDQVL